MKTSQVSSTAGPTRSPEPAKTQAGTPRRTEDTTGSRFGRLLDGAVRPGRHDVRDGSALVRGREEPEGLAAARARLMVDRDDDGRGGGFGRGGRGGSEARPETDRELLAPFAPPPPALVAPPSSGAPVAPPVAGSAAERAEVAALVDRLVTSMRVGRVGRDGHEVHLRLGSGIDVRLRHEHGELRAELRTEGTRREEAERIAETLEREMSARGVFLAALEVS